MFPMNSIPWDALGSGVLYLLLAMLGVLGVRASNHKPAPSTERVEVTGELISNTAMVKHAASVEMNTASNVDLKVEIKGLKQCIQTLIDVKKEEIRASEKAIQKTEEAQEAVEKLARTMKGLAEDIDTFNRRQR